MKGAIVFLVVFAHFSFSNNRQRRHSAGTSHLQRLHCRDTEVYTSQATHIAGISAFTVIISSLQRRHLRIHRMGSLHRLHDGYQAKTKKQNVNVNVTVNNNGANPPPPPPQN